MSAGVQSFGTMAGDLRSAYGGRQLSETGKGINHRDTETQPSLDQPCLLSRWLIFFLLAQVRPALEGFPGSSRKE